VVMPRGAFDRSIIGEIGGYASSMILTEAIWIKIELQHNIILGIKFGENFDNCALRLLLLHFLVFSFTFGRTLVLPASSSSRFQHHGTLHLLVLQQHMNVAIIGLGEHHCPHYCWVYLLRKPPSSLLRRNW